MKITYQDYLLSKQISAKQVGFEVDISDINSYLFDWQRAGVQWNCKVGKSADFWKMGLGKTLAQVEFARLVHKQTKAPCLIVSPLAVAPQTIREGQKIDVEIERIRTMDDARLTDCPITIVNFDMFRRNFEPWFWKDGAIIFDESSILSSYQGATKKMAIPFFNSVKYGLLCSGTPARNDYMELGNSAEALGVMKSSQMLANWFVTTSGKIKTGEIVTGKYKLKPFGKEDFWRWITTWATVVNVPSDIGGSDEGYILPDIDYRLHKLSVDHTRAWNNLDKKGQRYLLLPDNPSSTEMWAEKKITYQDRITKALEIAEEGSKEYQIFWCDLIKSAELLYKEMVSIYGKDAVVEVSGKDSIDNKEAKLDAFSRGDVLKIITKDQIAGMGLNWQHCAWQVFVSVNYKWESFAQRLARTNRFGQTKTTRADLIATETEQGILNALIRKGKQDVKMHKMTQMIYKKYGLWRTDKKSLITDMGNLKMQLPKWMNNGHIK